jgi:hypothetical protein
VCLILRVSEGKLKLNKFNMQATKPAGLWSCFVGPLRNVTCSNRFNLFRPIIQAALAAGILIASQNISYAQNPEGAASSQSLVNSAGVVTHLNYPDTVYGRNWPQVFDALKKLGVHHIRDGYFDVNQYPVVVQEHQQLLGAGIKTSYVVPWLPGLPVSSIQQLASATGDMDDLEGPNECDVLGQCGGGGSLGIANANAFLPTLQYAAQTLNVPLIAPSLVLPESYPISGNLDSLVNSNNLHLYFGGRNPGSNGWGDYDPQGHSYGSFDFWRDQSQINAPGLPMQIGETGYMSWPTTSTPFTVPENVTASYLPRTLLLAFKHGFDKTFFYQLIDDPTSPQGYGLLRNDFSEKPGFTALKNMLSLLSDPGANNFTPGSLPFEILGGDANVNHLLMEKSDGSFWLALWLEEPSWNPVNVQYVGVQPENIGIRLGSGYTTTTNFQFNDTGNYVGFNQPMYGNIASLTLTDQVSIIRIVRQ